MTTTTTSQPTRRIELLPLDDIPRAERNPRVHDIKRIRSSLEQFGCTWAGLLDERTGRLVAGHGRLATLTAMREDGTQPPEGVVDDDGEWMVPIVRGWSSKNDSEAHAYLIADNRINEFGTWDDRLLAEVLEDIADDSIDLLESAGYSSDELDDIVASLGDVVVMPPAPTGARYAETEEEFEERRERTSNYTDRTAGGNLTEMILVFTGEEHAEVVSLIRAVRSRDGEQTAAQIMLGALRAFAPDDAEDEAA